jgi:hypothetical protein
VDLGHSEAKAITAYLTERMPGYQVFGDTEGLSTHFTLVGDKTHYVAVNEDFYMGRDAETIRRMLEGWHIAEQLRNGARKIRIREESYEVLEQYT